MRLIDADALLEQYGLKDATKYGNENAEQQHKSYSTLMMYEIADMIYDAPTISAANWTPCSVALPKSDEVDRNGNDVEYLVTIASWLWTGRVVHHTTTAVYADELWQYSRNGCAAEDDLTNVIAWCPMLEPYRGEA